MAFLDRLKSSLYGLGAVGGGLPWVSSQQAPPAQTPAPRMTLKPQITPFQGPANMTPKNPPSSTKPLTLKALKGPMAGKRAAATDIAPKGQPAAQTAPPAANVNPDPTQNQVTNMPNDPSAGGTQGRAAIPNQQATQLVTPNNQNQPSTQTTPQNPYLAQLPGIESQLLQTGQMTPEEEQAQKQLNALIAKQAQLSSSETAGENQINQQATLTPFATGHIMNLKNQYNALQQSFEAQTLPLEQQLALAQARRASAEGVLGQELGFNERMAELQKPVNIGYGGTLVNPLTGQVIASGQERTSTLAPGATLVDPTTGEIIATGEPKFQPQTRYQQGGFVGGTGIFSPVKGGTAGGGVGTSPKGSGRSETFTLADIPSLANWIAKNNIPASMFPSLLGSGMSAASATVKQALTRELSTNHPEWNPVGAQSSLGASNVQAKTYNDLVNAQSGAVQSLGALQSLSDPINLSDSSLVADAQLEYGKVSGNQDVRNYLSVIEDVRSQAAKVLGGGTITDQSRKQAEFMLPANVSPSLMKKNIESIKTLMANRVRGFAQPTQIQTPGSSTAQSGTQPEIQTLADGSEWQQNPDGSYTKVK